VLAPLLGCLAAAASLSLVWPQVWLTCVRGRTSGLSPTACWLAPALNAGWVTYGLLAEEVVQVVTNGGCAVAGTAVLAALLRARPELRRPGALARTATGAAMMLAAAAAAALAALAGGVSPAVAAGPLSALLGVVAVAAAVPQPLSLLRDRTQDLSGLSPACWRLAVVAAGAWLGYGVLTDQVAVWGSAAVGLAAALVVCASLARAGAAGAVPSAPTSPLAVLRVPDAWVREALPEPTGPATRPLPVLVAPA